MFSYQRSSLVLALVLTAALTVGLGSSALAVAHAPTTPTSAVVTPANPTAHSDLQVLASGSIDVDGDVVTYKYQWQSKAPAGSWTDLVGENASTLSHPPLHRDWQYRVLVWAVSGLPEEQSPFQRHPANNADNGLLPDHISSHYPHDRVGSRWEGRETARGCVSVDIVAREYGST